MDNLTIRKLTRSDELSLARFLQPQLESSMFLYGNMQQAGLVYEGQRLQGFYVAAFDGDQMVGVVAHYWNGNICIQAPDHLENLLSEVIRISKLPLVGFIGPDDQVIRAKRILGISSSEMRHDEAEGLYSLDLQDLIVPKILNQPYISWRRAGSDDLELLTRWLVAMNVETLGKVVTPALHQNRRASVKRIIENGNTWILEVDGIPASTSGFNADIESSPGYRIVQIGGVFTPPELRRRGFARAVVAASLLDAKAESAAKAILFTGESNFPAQKAYAAIGFQRTGTYRLAFLKKPISK